MAIFSGPKISKTGSVFHYDMSNSSKSWKGAPTTNLWSYSQAFSNWSKTASITITDNNVISPLGDLTASKITASGAGGSYINLSGTFTSGNTYTKSVYAKAGSTPTLVFESYDNNGSGGTAYFPTTFNLLNGTYTTSSGDTATMIYITNGWYRCTVTRSYSLTVGSGTFYIGAYGAGVGFLYLWGAQAELGSFATPLVTTAGSTASRANTQALLDLTNQNTVTASSLTYTSDGTFSFNGSTNYIDSNVDVSWNNTNSVSIDVWIKPATSQYKPFIGKGTDYEWQLMQKYDALEFVYWNSSGGHTNGPIPSVSGVFSAGIWVHIGLVWSHTNNILTLYKNGNAISTVTWVDASINRNITNTVKIGGSLYTWGTQGNFWSGSIASVKIHNRALSAAEIQENFEATRGRYGI